MLKDNACILHIYVKNIKCIDFKFFFFEQMPTKLKRNKEKILAFESHDSQKQIKG